MYALYLNDMRASQVECVVAVARAATQLELEKFVESERVEPYETTRSGRMQWHKSFRQGGPLEWYNPPSETDSWGTGVRRVHTREEAIAQTGRDWDEWHSHVPPIEALQVAT